MFRRRTLRQSRVSQRPATNDKLQVTARSRSQDLADIAATRPDHGGVCPLCREEIKADAIRWMHCKGHARPGYLVPSSASGAWSGSRGDAQSTISSSSADCGAACGPVSCRYPIRRARTPASGGCADHITHNGMGYHLVDEGTTVDERGLSWHTPTSSTTTTGS